MIDIDVDFISVPKFQEVIKYTNKTILTQMLPLTQYQVVS